MPISLPRGADVPALVLAACDGVENLHVEDLVLGVHALGFGPSSESGSEEKVRALTRAGQLEQVEFFMREGDALMQLVAEDEEFQELPSDVQDYLRALVSDVQMRVEDLELALEQGLCAPDLVLQWERFGPPEIPLDDIELLDEYVGSGASARVAVGLLKGKRFAIKIPKAQTKLTDKQLASFRREVELQKKIFHPHCALLIGACSVRGSLRIVTELCDMDLKALLDRKDQVPLSFSQKMGIARDAASGLAWLHDIVKLIHRDLKPANILISVEGDKFVPKLADFGFAQLWEDYNRDTTGVLGTPYYMSPELLLVRPFTASCDVYAFGIVLWQILTRSEPFQMYQELKPFKDAVCRRNERPAIPKDCPANLAALIKDCWMLENAEREQLRPTASQVVERLTDLTFSSLVPAGPALDVWRKHLVRSSSDMRYSIPVSEFVQKIYTLLRPAKIQFPRGTFTALKEILGSPRPDGSSHVTLEAFVAVSRAFGTFWEPKQSSADVLHDIRMTAHKDWYHGFISKDEAERRVCGARDAEGNMLDAPFLVRMSDTVPDHPFCLTTLSPTPGELCLHRRIFHVEGADYKYSGRSANYQLLSDAIEACRDSRVQEQMVTACPRVVDTKRLGYEDLENQNGKSEETLRE